MGVGGKAMLQTVAVWVTIVLLHPFPYRSQRVYFADFARVLAYFRPIDEDDATLRDPKQPEPLNSRMNKLRCECVRPAQVRPSIRRDPGTSNFPCGSGEDLISAQGNSLPLPLSFPSCISAL